MIKNQALGGRSNKALLFLGLFLALVSAVLVVYYLSQTSDGGGTKTSGDGTPVVVASRNISPGTRLTKDMLTVKPIPGGALLNGAFKEADLEKVVGQVTRLPLVEGEQVIPNKVTATGAAITNADNPPLSLIVPEGMRGVSVQISGGTAASGLILPGDFVDVILTIEVEGEGTGGGEAAATASDETKRDVFSRTILQGVQVLSIDQDVALTVSPEDAEGSASDSGEEVNPDATTATLAVPLSHAEVLNAAETCGINFNGRLSLALRAFGDDSQVGSRSAWPADGPAPTCSAVLGLPSLQ